MYWLIVILGMVWSSCSRYSKAQISWFERIETNADICEIVQSVPGTLQKEDRNFTCGLENCLQWCEVNTGCRVAMYKPGHCRLLAVAETTDTTRLRYLEYSEYTTYKKYGKFGLPYYSQKCSEFTRRSCKGECGWSKGKPGYNRPIYGGFEGKWCGRVKCI